jgi:Restriction endonuclease PvuII
MKPHPDKARLDALFPAVIEYQKLAASHGITDIFQDNGGKILQVILALGLKVLGKREGNDAVDADGNEYELKSVNIALQRQVTTHHHLNPVILAKYRKVNWIIAVYRNIELLCIYRMTPADLEPLFSRWEGKWHADGGRDINNPKIPLDFVVANGKLIFGTAPEIRVSRRGPQKVVTVEGKPLPPIVVGEEDIVVITPANGTDS